MQARETANNNSPVNFRKSPNGAIIAQIEQGTIVEVLSQHNDIWSIIQIHNQTGYMMTKFLAPINNTTTIPSLSELKEELKKVLAILDKLEGT